MKRLDWHDIGEKISEIAGWIVIISLAAMFICSDVIFVMALIKVLLG